MLLGFECIYVYVVLILYSSFSQIIVLKGKFCQRFNDNRAKGNDLFPKNSELKEIILKKYLTIEKLFGLQMLSPREHFLQQIICEQRLDLV